MKPELLAAEAEAVKLYGFGHPSVAAFIRGAAFALSLSNDARSDDA